MSKHRATTKIEQQVIGNREPSQCAYEGLTMEIAKVAMIEAKVDETTWVNLRDGFKAADSLPRCYLSDLSDITDICWGQTSAYWSQAGGRSDGEK